VNATLLLIAAAQQKSSIFSLLILVLPLGAVFYLMVVPQRKQKAKHQQFISSIDVGSEVVTAGGMYGRITHIEDGIAHLEVDTDVVIRVSMSSLSRAATEPDPADSPEASSEPSSADENSVGDSAD
jgi:preprotein translocase subunit YajC